MIILDTNVVSETMRPEPDGNVLAWLESMPWRLSHITVMTVAELLEGVFRMPAGRRRDAVQEQVDSLLMTYDGRVLGVDPRTAPYFAEIRASRRRHGRPIDVPDAWIAAACRRHDVPLVTRNVKDFEGTGIAVINPWETA
ncbi:type II toxin-antitoxin system VapC family toxin [Knoellia sp. CPCC 206453]|uniref:type II toxin-antitoxin system VapC family toxin n=1 Tax=Knoellia pratensis TaxID=3404796 RepID=UPI0036184422